MGMIDKLELLMNENGLDKAALSRSTGIPYTTVDGFWKKGTDNIKRSSLLKLTRYFNCTLDYLADDNIDIHSEVFKNRDLFLKASAIFSPQEIQMIECYRILDERGKSAVDNALNHEYRYAKGECPVVSLDKEGQC